MALLGALQEMPEEVARRIVPAERAVMLLSVSRAMREAIKRVRPVARVKVKMLQTMERVEGGLPAMSQWLLVTTLDLSFLRIEYEGAERLAAVLGQCPSLAHLNLGENGIGAEGAGRLAAVLGQCPSLAHLGLSYNDIGDEGLGRLAAVLPQCTSLAN